MRSKLFVPGSRPELFAKALASEADAISLDLEDAVIDSQKAEARRLVAEFLRSDALRSSRKVVIVRTNAVGAPHFEADVRCLVKAGAAVLNIPKVESTDDVLAAVAVLARAEQDCGIERAVEILANIETARGMHRAADIASAHARVIGLQLGYADLFESLGIERCDASNVHAAMFAVRVAAGQAGKFAYDGAYPDVRDGEGFRAEAVMARRLGFLGKSCIHPKQIALANEVFTPSEAELAYAERVVEAARPDAAGRQGAFLLDGRMIDAPMIRRAEAIVAASRASAGDRDECRGR
jgi:citrate lyase subunit beta/citryl-CoA lyase